MTETSHAILALIAELKAKAADPDAGELTRDLVTLTLQSVLPEVRRSQPSRQQRVSP